MGPQVPRPVARVIGSGAGAVRLAAAAVVHAQAAAPEIAGAREFGVELGSLLLPVGK